MARWKGGIGSLGRDISVVCFLGGAYKMVMCPAVVVWFLFITIISNTRHSEAVFQRQISNPSFISVCTITGPKPNSLTPTDLRLDRSVIHPPILNSPLKKTKMSAIMTTAARPALQQASRQLVRRQQNFSIMHNLRSFARSFEPHPFQRLPVTSTPAPADWSKLVKRSAKQAVVYVLSSFTHLYLQLLRNWC